MGREKTDFARQQTNFKLNAREILYRIAFGVPIIMGASPQLIKYSDTLPIFKLSALVAIVYVLIFYFRSLADVVDSKMSGKYSRIFAATLIVGIPMIAAIYFALGCFLMVYIVFTFVYKHYGVALIVLSHTQSALIFSIFMIVMAIGAYWLRCVNRIAYGIIEFCSGIIMSYTAILPFPDNIEPINAWQVCIQIIAGMYILVRGIDNIDNGIWKSNATNTILIFRRIRIILFGNPT